MKRGILSILLLIISVTTVISAQDNFSIESRRIGEYKGFTGFWTEPADAENLEYIIKTYGSSEKKIILINGSDYMSQERIFLPLSDSYLAYMKTKGTAQTGSGICSDFDWPIMSFDRLTSTFGKRWNTFHEGIDIPAGKGTPIAAAGSGRVIVARFMDNYGLTVWLEHRDNIITRYCHASEILVKEGDIVTKGQVIANVGSTGNSTGNHLHFELRYGDFPMNPLDFLPYNPGVNKNQYLRKID
ncbi:MAG TPA: M23 family metallopeptidase [Spirochaetota bacterium]|nr:M23 family metallopeptidase [Spirochaetota bacterium]